jgi:hypothetical protein
MDKAHTHDVDIRGTSLPSSDETDRGGLGTDSKAKEDMDDTDVDALAWHLARCAMQRCPRSLIVPICSPSRSSL